MEEVFQEYPGLPAAISQILALGEDKFQTLREAISSSDGFDRSRNRSRDLAGRLGGLTPRDVSNILGSLWFLYVGLRQFESSAENATAPLMEFVDFIGLNSWFPEPLTNSSYERLAELVSKKPDVERQREIQWLQTGVADLAVDFSAFLDLRPRFSEDGSDLEELVPVVVFRVAVESDNGPGRAHVFQITRDGMDELFNVLEGIEEQLSTVRSNKLIGSLVNAALNGENDAQRTV
jgi:hypothetical protein